MMEKTPLVAPVLAETKLMRVPNDEAEANDADEPDCRVAPDWIGLLRQSEAALSDMVGLFFNIGTMKRM